MEYVFEEVWQTVVLPVMAPGVAGRVVMLITNVLAAEVPQRLEAVTEMVPPDAPAVALMLVVVLEPDQPPGSVQVYEVAPGTPVML